MQQILHHSITCFRNNCAVRFRVESMGSKLNFFGDSDGERLAQLLKLINCGGDRGFGTEEVLLFFVNRLSLGD
jgi:hypothetical protein